MVNTPILGAALTSVTSWFIFALYMMTSGKEGMGLAGEGQPAVMVPFSTEEKVRSLRKRLGQIAPEMSGIEVEEVVLYGDVAPLQRGLR